MTADRLMYVSVGLAIVGIDLGICAALRIVPYWWPLLFGVLGFHLFLAAFVWKFVIGKP